MSHIPSGAELGMPHHSPVQALWYAARYLRAYEQPVFVGKLTTMMNLKLKEWGKTECHFMDDSVRRFCREGHSNSLAAYLPAGWTVVCGKRGVPLGHARVFPPWYAKPAQAPAKAEAAPCPF